MNRIQLTYRQRNRLLLWGTPLFGVLAYWVSIRQTIELYQANQRLEVQLETIRQSPRMIRDLERKLTRYENVLKSFRSDSLHQGAYLLDRITESCRQHQVRLVSLPVSQLSVQQEYEIETQMVKIKGGFSNLLQVVYDLEYHFSVGRISSVRFVTEEDRRSRTMDLFVYVYIQNVRVRYEEE